MLSVARSDPVRNESAEVRQELRPAGPEGGGAEDVRDRHLRGHHGQSHRGDAGWGTAPIRSGALLSDPKH